MGFFRRIAGAMMLDPATYEDVESHPSALAQATLTVILSSLSAGFGALGVFRPDLSTLVTITALALVTWLAWAMLTLQIGTRLLPTRETHADFGELVRTLGFAAAPGLFQVLAVFPHVTLPVFIGTGLWMLAAMVVAVRQALDFTSTARALLVCAVALAISLGLALAIGVWLAPTAQ